MRFNRDVAPPASVTKRGAIPSALAMVKQSAAFASPAAGTARTRTLSTQRPSACASMRSTASRPPLGVSRTVSETPSFDTTQGRAVGAGTTASPVADWG